MGLFLRQWKGGGASFFGARLHSCRPTRCQIHCDAQGPSREVLIHFSIKIRYIYLYCSDIITSSRLLCERCSLYCPLTFYCVCALCVFACERAGFIQTICTLAWLINLWRIFMSEYQNRCICLTAAWLRGPSVPAFTTPLSTT